MYLRTMLVSIESVFIVLLLAGGLLDSYFEELIGSLAGVFFDILLGLGALHGIHLGEKLFIGELALYYCGVAIEVDNYAIA